MKCHFQMLAVIPGDMSASLIAMPVDTNSEQTCHRMIRRLEYMTSKD